LRVEASWKTKKGFYLEAQLETTPAKSGKHSSGIVNGSDLSHASHVLSREAGIGILSFASITNVNELRSRAQFLANFVKVLRQLARPSFHANIVLGHVPAAAELPNYEKDVNG
jgi:hypothetical protein